MNNHLYALAIGVKVRSALPQPQPQPQRQRQQVATWLCPHCSFQTEDNNEKAYRHHIVNKHKGMNSNPDKNGRRLPE